MGAQNQSQIKALISIFTWIVACHFFASEALAGSLQLNHRVNVRSQNQKNSLLKTIGQLHPGTVVRVPEGDLKQRFDQLKSSNSNELLIEWLLKSGAIFEFEDYKGELKKDYFFPVEVVSGSNRQIQKGAIVYVPIRYLVEKQGIEMVAGSRAEVVAIKPPGQMEWKFSVSELSQKLAGNLRYIEISKDQKFRTQKSKKNHLLKNNCKISEDFFKSTVGDFANYYKVSKEITFSLLEMESSGDCHAFRKELNGSFSVGLFQLNTNSTKIPVCDDYQISRLEAAKNNEIFFDPKLNCLQNPIVNLKEAMNSLRAKYAAVNTQNQPSIYQWDLMDPSSRDSWRKALAAYNGGEAYIFQAYNDIQEVNQSHGLHLNADDWEVRRLFLMRGMLRPQDRAKFFESKAKYNRHKRLTYMNIIYVETISGREHRNVFDQKTLVSKWLQELYPQTQMQLAAESNFSSCWFCKNNFQFLVDE